MQSVGAARIATITSVITDPDELCNDGWLAVNEVDRRWQRKDGERRRENKSNVTMGAVRVETNLPEACADFTQFDMKCLTRKC